MQINNNIKEKFVKAIKDGLYETKVSAEAKNKQIHNAIRFEKLDNIANCLIDTFVYEPTFKTVKLKRGSYVLAFIYDAENKIIYSALSQGRFKTLISRKDLSNVHYFDALIDFNDNEQISRQQLVINENLLGKDDSEVREIKDQIVNLLNGDAPEKYVSICFEIDRFRLCSVKAVLTSKYLEIVDSEDWSEFIEIDYNDVLYASSDITGDNDKLEITLKDNIPRKNNDSAGLMIPVKRESIEKHS